MNASPRAVRPHIALFGRRNAGKSSLINALTGQRMSLVSPVAGTTADPVEKSIELHGVGAVVMIDTPGLDDVGDLGDLKTRRTLQVFERTDVGVLVVGGPWGGHEETVLSRLRQLGIAGIVAFNKCDLGDPDAELVRRLHQDGFTVLLTSALTGSGVEALRSAVAQAAKTIESPAVLGDLVGPGEMAVLVVPIDPEAPRGRLILPQVQAIRDLLDSDAMCMVVKERELKAALDRLKVPPRLVVTDSQAFLKVAADTPRGIMLTSFSILFARLKGDLVRQAEGAAAIDTLRPGDRVLIAEACAHHPQGEDIGRVKIPRWLTQYVGGALEFDTVQGRDFPDDLSPYRLVVHCGACMWNRRQMQARIESCREAGVAITNYGIAIAYSLGILERALQPFPAALEAVRRVRREALAC